jgi:hypothetical protein
MKSPSNVPETHVKNWETCLAREILPPEVSIVLPDDPKKNTPLDEESLRAVNAVREKITGNLEP